MNNFAVVAPERGLNYIGIKQRKKRLLVAGPCSMIISQQERSAYIYLCFSTLEQWLAAYLEEDGKTTWIQKALFRHMDSFAGCLKAATKYEHLVPSKLEQWENRCLVREGNTLTLRKQRKEFSKTLRSTLLFLDCADTKQKYAHAFESGALHDGLDIATSDVLSVNDRARWATVEAVD